MAISLITALLILPQAEAPAPQAAPTPAAKPICRREAPLGSIMPVRTCHTRAEWAAIDGANNDAASEIRRAAGSRSGTIGGGR